MRIEERNSERSGWRVFLLNKFFIAVVCVPLAAVSLLTQQPEPAAANSEAGFPQTPPAKTIRVNGADLAYVEQGRGEPVILIHGFLQDYRVWSGQIGEFSEHFRVIAYSMPHRWPNAPPEDDPDLSTAANVADLAALIRALGLGRAHLVGHSGGANVALRVALKHPELVRSLVLGEPGRFAVAVDHPEARPLATPALRDEARQAYERGDTETALEIIREAVLGKDAAARPGPAWVRQIALDNAWQLKWPPASPEPPLTCDQLARINVPALLLGGDRSPKIFQLVLNELQKCLPVAERAVLPDSSHGLELENPAAFNEIVLEFLTRHASRARRR